ncbi:hypothetical protein [Paracoccus isoporae]|nr:hypothetical protein [Paracoccus isoporae]
MRNKITPLAAAFAFMAVPAFAQITTDQVNESLAGQGYTDVVITAEDETSISASAVSGEGQSVNIVYDRMSGAVQSATAADGSSSTGAEEGDTVTGSEVATDANPATSVTNEEAAASPSGAGAEAGSTIAASEEASDNATATSVSPDESVATSTGAEEGETIVGSEEATN